MCPVFLSLLFHVLFIHANLTITGKFCIKLISHSHISKMIKYFKSIQFHLNFDWKYFDQKWMISGPFEICDPVHSLPICGHVISMWSQCGTHVFTILHSCGVYVVPMCLPWCTRMMPMCYPCAFHDALMWCPCVTHVLSMMHSGGAHVDLYASGSRNPGDLKLSFLFFIYLGLRSQIANLIKLFLPYQWVNKVSWQNKTYEDTKSEMHR